MLDAINVDYVYFRETNTSIAMEESHESHPIEDLSEDHDAAPQGEHMEISQPNQTNKASTYFDEKIHSPDTPDVSSSSMF